MADAIAQAAAERGAAPKSVAPPRDSSSPAPAALPDGNSREPRTQLPPIVNMPAPGEFPPRSESGDPFPHDDIRAPTWTTGGQSHLSEAAGRFGLLPPVSVAQVAVRRTPAMALGLGLAVAMLGALAWAMIEVSTGLRQASAAVAIAIGFGVGVTLRNVAGTRGSKRAAQAVILTTLGCVLGSALGGVLLGAKANNVSPFDAPRLVGFSQLLQLNWTSLPYLLIFLIVGIAAAVRATI